MGFTLSNLSAVSFLKTLIAMSPSPTDEELLHTFGGAKRDHCYDGPIDDWPKRAERAATIHALRVVLARWGQPAATPVSGSER